MFELTSHSQKYDFKIDNMSGPNFFDKILLDQTSAWASANKCLKPIAERYGFELDEKNTWLDNDFEDCFLTNDLNHQGLFQLFCSLPIFI